MRKIWQTLMQVTLCDLRWTFTKTPTLQKPHQRAKLRTAIGLGLIETLAKSENAIAAIELAILTGIEKLLVGMFVMSWQGVFQQSRDSSE